MDSGQSKPSSACLLQGVGGGVQACLSGTIKGRPSPRPPPPSWTRFLPLWAMVSRGRASYASHEELLEPPMVWEREVAGQVWLMALQTFHGWEGSAGLRKSNENCTLRGCKPNCLLAGREQMHEGN